jgi:hypothetical protein
VGGPQSRSGCSGEEINPFLRQGQNPGRQVVVTSLSELGWSFYIHSPPPPVVGSPCSHNAGSDDHVITYVSGKHLEVAGGQYNSRKQGREKSRKPQPYHP